MLVCFETNMLILAFCEKSRLVGMSRQTLFLGRWLSHVRFFLYPFGKTDKILSRYLRVQPFLALSILNPELLKQGNNNCKIGGVMADDAKNYVLWRSWIFYLAT